MLKGTSSNWKLLNCGVPQGSVLGPLLFLLYINDLVDSIKNYSINLFADDTCIYFSSRDQDLCAKIRNDDLELIHQLSKKWKVKFNFTKTVSLHISNKNTELPNLLLDGEINILV